MICAFAAVIGVFALVNAKEKPIEYSREELAELFEKYPVSLLCKEFDEKKVILSNPSSKEELNALIGSLTLEDPKLFEYDGKKSTIYSGTTENCESFAFLENDEEKVLVIENTDNNENREQWAHIFHLKERTVTESFFKSDVKNDLHIKLTFEGEYLSLIGVFFAFPLWYDLFKGRTALKEVFESKEKAIELFLLSIVSVDVVLLLIKIYLMIKQLPLSTKY